MTLQNLNYPLDFKFKITTISSDFSITDRNGNNVAYVREKLFRLKEDVLVYSNSSKEEKLFQIKANQWLDFNASYSLRNLIDNTNYGRVSRRGMKSIWRASYDIKDHNDITKFTITEDNALVKFFDSFVSGIPIIGYFSGYILNPTYSVKDASDKTVFQLKKQPSFFGRKFKLEQQIDIDNQDETLIILSLLMMVLLERSNG